MNDIFLAFFIAFILVLVFMPVFLRWASKAAIQPIYEDAPASHQAKGKTPTMGGVVFVLAAVVSALLVGGFNISILLGCVVLVGFCAIGMCDDLKKIRGKANHAGLSARAKMALLLLLAFIVSAGLYFTNAVSSKLVLAYFGEIFDMGYFVIVFWVLVIISAANALNLTDGLDGLAAGSCISTLVAFAAILLGKNLILESAFLLPLISALVGALVGFLCYNTHPAKVFMGDSGSLALGAFVGFLAIVCKAEILLILIGLVYVAETASVIIQVFSFRVFGKRVFKMSPLHHHFEQCGWAENHITFRFWVVSALCAIIGAIIALKF